jgi:hypothetical protein
MAHQHGSRSHKKQHAPSRPSRRRRIVRIAAFATITCVILVILFGGPLKKAAVDRASRGDERPPAAKSAPADSWIERARLVSQLYHQVYTPGWEGAYGALGDAYLFTATHDSALLRFHLVEHPLTQLSNGYWLDDRAWACLAELTWWEATGRTNMQLVADAAQRYREAKDAGMLSSHEGYWAWYKYPPNLRRDDPVFTNTNMNQMVNVACRLYDATRDGQYLKDALLVWNGDRTALGIEKRLYKGEGRWKGREGQAAFGKELPWNGTGYCSIGAALYRSTKDSKYKQIVVATARRILDPASGWVDPVDFYQLHMDGNGAFVHFLLDAYSIAPAELPDVPMKVGRMLEHVWTNAHSRARVMLHRTADHGIRNGWNPEGGEDGYGVNEVGTVHAQGEAARAFGVFALYYPASANAIPR